jgi:GTP-binding protein Era
MDSEQASFEQVPEGHKSGFVAVVGIPNAGKSTLINAFMQQKIAIVTPRPQTTRTRQLGILTTPDYQIIFIDTPGIMKEPRHKLDSFMLNTALNTLQDSDVILWVMDGSTMPGPADQLIAERLANLQDNKPIVLAINKNDLVPPDRVMPVTEAYQALVPEAAWLFISAANGLGTEALLQTIVDALPEGPRFYPPDQITDAYLRDIAAEMIREQLLIKLREEIPHGVAVQVEEFKERENGVTYISANIFVERENHKKIVIGKRGSMLKSIGRDARREVEQMTGAPIYLDLWVKTAPDWREEESSLRRFGYTEQ